MEEAKRIAVGEGELAALIVATQANGRYVNAGFGLTGAWVSEGSWEHETVQAWRAAAAAEREQEWFTAVEAVMEEAK